MADPKTPDERLEAAIADSSVPHLYANGFSNAVTSADLMILLETNGQPVALLNISHILAKTLVLKLGELVGQVEAVTGTKIATTDEFNAAAAERGMKK